jgi:hypothetical protein
LLAESHLTRRLFGVMVTTELKLASGGQNRDSVDQRMAANAIMNGTLESKMEMQGSMGASLRIVALGLAV